MEYEVVTLEEKTAAGVMAWTNNAAEDMGSVIGGLWKQFYGEGVYGSIMGKKNHKSLGIYTDYAGDEKSDYRVVVACEVEPAKEFPADVVPANGYLMTIPAGKYAKFVIKGDVKEDVAKFWEALWQMKLPRTFTCDFEEYQDCSESEAEIHIYISIADAV